MNLPAIARTLTACSVALMSLTAHAEIHYESQERDALEAFFKSTGGNGWHHADGWMTDAPIHQWYGVSSSYNRVVGLRLPDNGLIGELPEEMALLTHLGTLDLRSNELTGSLPDLSSLDRLNHLVLADNRISGNLQNWSVHLTNLATIDLSRNQLEGQIPTQLSHAHSLKFLDLHDNQLGGIIPPDFGDIKNLVYLDLSQNCLKGNIPVELESLATLAFLNVSQNELDSHEPDVIAVVALGVDPITPLSIQLATSDWMKSEVHPHESSSASQALPALFTDTTPTVSLASFGGSADKMQEYDFIPSNNLNTLRVRLKVWNPIKDGNLVKAQGKYEWVSGGANDTTINLEMVIYKQPKKKIGRDFDSLLNDHVSSLTVNPSGRYKGAGNYYAVLTVTPRSQSNTYSPKNGVLNSDVIGL